MLEKALMQIKTMKKKKSPKQTQTNPYVSLKSQHQNPFTCIKF